MHFYKYSDFIIKTLDIFANLIYNINGGNTTGHKKPWYNFTIRILKSKQKGMIFLNEITITNRDGKLTVSSLQVAKDFGKRHDHIMRDIENLIAGTSAESSANLTTQNWGVKSFFTENTYINERGRTYECYDITRDGFSLLVMGFTGKKALEWKLKYIEAFNLMEQQLLNRNGLNVNLEELITKTITMTISETIKVLVPLINHPAPSVTEISDDKPKRIRKKYRYTTPSKISMLEPELKQKVDEMIISGEYSCQQIANFIMNNSDIEISQMAVNRYKRINFV